MSQIHVFCEIKKKLDKGKRMMWILSFVFGLELSPCVDVLNPNLAFQRSTTCLSLAIWEELFRNEWQHVFVQCGQ